MRWKENMQTIYSNSGAASYHDILQTFSEKFVIICAEQWIKTIKGLDLDGMTVKHSLPLPLQHHCGVFDAKAPVEQLSGQYTGQLPVINVFNCMKGRSCKCPAAVVDKALIKGLVNYTAAIYKCHKFKPKMLYIRNWNVKSMTMKNVWY